MTRVLTLSLMASVLALAACSSVDMSKSVAHGKAGDQTFEQKMTK